MDAAAYLKKHGWRGTGHSLDHTDRGIVKPLQISKKIDYLGIGINKYASVSDQWWMRAYDQGLKDLGSGKESALATAQKHGVNRGGLYARFVKGKEIPGTIGQREGGITTEQVVDSALPAPSRKRKALAVVDTMESSAPPHTEPTASTIKQQIKAFVDEATRQGILPAAATKASRKSKYVAPTQAEMEAVLRLAKIQNRTAVGSQLAEREKLVRNLKRAALKYLETRIEVEPI